MIDIGFLKSEIILAGAGLVLLALEMIRPEAKRMAAFAAYAALAAAAYFQPNPGSLSGGFSLLVLAGTAVTLIMVQADTFQPRRSATYTALVFFATIGCLLLVKSSDFLLAFVAIELISISSFILVAYERQELASMEGAVKYFLVGAFSAAIGIYGISLFYGAAGSLEFSAAAAVSSSGEWGPWLGLGGLLLILGSFAFKASIVPFHFWVPDAYQSAPTPVTAYLSVVPKMAALAVMLHVFSFAQIPGQALIQTGGLGAVIALLACLTMTVGNISALHQTDLKRLLAYSSIAQAGYMMIGILAASALGTHAVLFYGFAYLFMNFGAFACAMWVERKTGSYEIRACDSLALTHFPFALMFSAFLLSLAGIPPLAGFVGKYLVFASVLESGWMGWISVVGAINSVISVYYYLGIAYRMFFIEKSSPALRSLAPSPLLMGVLIFLLAGTIIFGVYPSPLLALSGIR